MLGNPKYGWTNVSIGEFYESAGYLTDVPNDCLDASHVLGICFIPVVFVMNKYGEKFSDVFFLIFQLFFDKDSYF